MLRTFSRPAVASTNAVRTFLTSLPTSDRPRSKALGAVRGTGQSQDMLDITNLEEFAFDDSTTVHISILTS